MSETNSALVVLSEIGDFSYSQAKHFVLINYNIKISGAYLESYLVPAYVVNTFIHRYDFKPIPNSTTSELVMARLDDNRTPYYAQLKDWLAERERMNAKSTCVVAVLHYTTEIKLIWLVIDGFKIRKRSLQTISHLDIIPKLLDFVCMYVYEKSDV